MRICLIIIQLSSLLETKSDMCPLRIMGLWWSMEADANKVSPMTLFLWPVSYQKRSGKLWDIILNCRSNSGLQTLCSFIIMFCCYFYFHGSTMGRILAQTMNPWFLNNVLRHQTMNPWFVGLVASVIGRNNYYCKIEGSVILQPTVPNLVFDSMQ